MKGEYPSLNLAQSVMIYAWELSGINVTSLTALPGQQTVNISRKRPGVTGQIAKGPAEAKFRHLRTSIEELLTRSGFDKNSPLFNRIMERIEAVGDKDASLLLSVCSKIAEVVPRE